MTARSLQIALHVYNLGIEKSRAAYNADRLAADGWCARNDGRRTHERNRRCWACIRAGRTAP